MKLHKVIAVLVLSGMASVSLNASANLSSNSASAIIFGDEAAQKSAIIFDDEAAQRAAIIFGDEQAQKSAICGRIVAQNVDSSTAGYWINRCTTECGGHITRMGWGGLTVRCN